MFHGRIRAGSAQCETVLLGPVISNAPPFIKAISLERPKIPKVREYAEIVLTNGAVLAGYVFVDATARIQDLLNSESLFIAFIDKEERIHLVNKSAIIEVRPFDQ